MQRYKYFLVAISLSFGPLAVVRAQDPHAPVEPDADVTLAAAPDPAEPPAPRPNPAPERFGGMPPFRMPLALRDALDADGDGKISADEMKNATAALQKLDKNQDGKLDADEIGWPPRMPNFGRGGFPGGPGGPGGGGRSFVERLLSRDANGDGKVTAAELPKSMHFLLRQGDQNGDGALDAKEVEQLARKLGLAGQTPPAAAPQR